MMSQILSGKSSVDTHCQCLIMLAKPEGTCFFLQTDLESLGYYGGAVCIIRVSATDPDKTEQLELAPPVGMQ